ncbi:MAG TPA: hypothetical protein VLU24_10275 [Mycobacterium sp.]|nr:hypothetical protein [Mycobacterium sp.]
MKAARVFPVFSIAFAVLYVLAMENNWALFTYFARAREFHWLVVAPPTPRMGPAMYWYGWLATSALGAGVVATAAALLRADRAAGMWRGLSWAVPLAAIAVLVFLLRGWFIRMT